jgi:hypothetical protein
LAAWKENDPSESTVDVMNDTLNDSQNEVSASKAIEAGLEAIYFPNENTETPGTWHFTQQYNEGRTISLTD